MKKIGVFIVLLLLIFSITTVFAKIGDECASTISDCDVGEICEDEICVADSNAEIESESTTTSSTSGEDKDKIESGFECLEEKAADCSSLSTEEIALTILSTPDNIFKDCVEELQSRKESDNWGNTKHTAMAIMALTHAGKDTDASEDWLISQARTPTELIWYLQQDSEGETGCNINYKQNDELKDYTISVGEDKKITGNAGPCLDVAQGGFWLKISPACLEQEFSIECDKDFIATTLYKNQKSSAFYILEGTDSSSAGGSIKLNIKSKCFGDRACDYESTAWAALALLNTGQDIKEYIPYLIAMSDSNQKYLPWAFVYTLTRYDDYANQLITEQRLGGYWEAPQTANNKFYDTSLALIALSKSSSEQITKAREWLLDSQGSNGCWQNSIKETAAVLWALDKRPPRSSGGGSGSITLCEDAGLFCIPAKDCPSEDDVGTDSYYCGLSLETCCKSENLKSCSEYGGEICIEDEICVGGNSKKATDALDNNCCMGECKDKPTDSECELRDFECMDSCADYEEEVSYSCDGKGVCCKPKETGSKDSSSSGSSMWIWILVILILLVLIAIGWVKREELKVYAFKLKEKFKKDKGGGANSRGGFPPRPGPGPRRGPPRPGFPPIRRPAPPVAPPRRSTEKRSDTMSETFKKLREMSS